MFTDYSYLNPDRLVELIFDDPAHDVRALAYQELVTNCGPDDAKQMIEDEGHARTQISLDENDFAGAEQALKDWKLARQIGMAWMYVAAYGRSQELVKGTEGAMFNSHLAHLINTNTY